MRTPPRSSKPSPVIARRARLFVAVGLAGVVLVIALGALTGSAQAKTVWLCRPGLAKDPCTSPLTATIVQTDGQTSIEDATVNRKAPIDCFYVYPTVSNQTTENANLNIEPQETSVAIEQASRFSQVCKVYAPMYPQVTLAALGSGKPVSAAASVTAFIGVAKAFAEYLAKYNHGRGFVLLGHSQGSLILERLIQGVIDPNPALRRRLVSADLMGGNVLVPEHRLVGGTFRHVPVCLTAARTHCVIAYSSFLKEPPQGAFFGRENSPLLQPGVKNVGKEVVCVNPALPAQNGATGALLPYVASTPASDTQSPFRQPPTASTPWVASVGEYTGRCRKDNGASWLQIDPVGPPVDPPEYVKEELGPDWGLHVDDVNIALGNLVRTTAIQSAAYASKH
ncbi:MAG: hypothetical protein JWN10_2368 [Solirubrobacterales bacterium]|nr:hypothetical protein [Solirubrobacterales bacterium]